MSGSYRQCSECGKRALSIATRCPGCGRALPAPATPNAGRASDLRRFLGPTTLAVMVPTTVILALGLARIGHPLNQQSSALPVETARLDTATAAAVPAEDSGELLVARTWTSVRKSRSRKADLEVVLLPGDTVLADSLDRGWYRVALEGEVVGYVHRSTLKAP